MMNSGMTMRPATDADSAAVRELVFACLVEHGLTPDPHGIDRDLFAIEATFAGAGGCFEVLVDGEDAVIGTVGLLPLGDGRCELRKMYLAPGHRGQGLGRRMLEYALERARSLGFKRVELETVSILQTAIRMYESAGFLPFEPDHRSAGPDRVDRAYYIEW